MFDSLKLMIVPALLVFLTSSATLFAADKAELHIVPWPKSMNAAGGMLTLTDGSRIVATDPTLEPLAKVLSDDVYRVADLRLATTTDKPKAGDIVLSLDKSLKDETYKLDINDIATIHGGNYRAVVWGTSTLLQALNADGKSVQLPKMAVKDSPDTEFRSVMLDLARRWHPIGTVKDTIVLLQLYKIPYLHLHLSDNESCVYTSKAFPKLSSSRRSYSIEEMNDLVHFADERGVTIIPEIDMPGHSGSWVGDMPEIFGTTDPATGNSKNIGIVNMASEKAYDALDTLVGELCDTFKSSPYIHIGADETSADGLKKLPEYAEYTKKHGLKEAAAGHSDELFTHFIVRMSEIVKKHGRKMIVWNGFPTDDTADVKIPKDDMVVMAWNGSPLDLTRKGFKIINCAWVPLYMVPTQGRVPLSEWIYNWNSHQAGSWGSGKFIEIPLSAKLLGAQICVWEQRYNEVLPMLRPRVPALSERLWNVRAGKSFADFTDRSSGTDAVFGRIATPVSIEAQGLIDPTDVTFEKELTVSLKTDLKGTIRYTTSKPWEEFPTADSPAYDKPIVLDDTMTVSAQLFGEDGQPIGGITQQRFSKITPAYHYRVLGPAPIPAWKELPNFAKLKVLQTGVTGLMTTDRGEQINRSMFAGLNPHGHIDVRAHDMYNPYAIELTGEIKIPTDGDYTIKMKARTGQAQLQIGKNGERLLAKPEVTTPVKLKAGTYPITIQYYWSGVFNDLNIKYQGPGMSGFEPFEKLVVPLDDTKKDDTKKD